MHAAYVAGWGDTAFMMLRPPCTDPCPRGMQSAFHCGWSPPQVVVVAVVVVLGLVDDELDELVVVLRHFDCRR